MDNSMWKNNAQAIKQDPERIKKVYSEAIKYLFFDFGWTVEEICEDLMLPNEFVYNMIEEIDSKNASRTEKDAN